MTDRNLCGRGSLSHKAVKSRLGREKPNGREKGPALKCSRGVLAGMARQKGESKTHALPSSTLPFTR